MPKRSFLVTPAARVDVLQAVDYLKADNAQQTVIERFGRAVRDALDSIKLFPHASPLSPDYGGADEIRQRALKDFPYLIERGLAS